MLKRYMQDVDHDPVYHKRASANTPFETVPIVFLAASRDHERARTEADVLRLAQLGCLDFHPWPSRRGHRPSRRVATRFRPDPPDTTSST